MAERPNTVAGLIDKRREITGQIEHHQRILNDLIIALDHLDCDAGPAEAVPAAPRGYVA